MKSEIRRQMLAARRALDEETRQKCSRIIAEKLFETKEYRAAKHVMCYAAYNCEVQTREICERILSDGKCLYLPRCTAPGKMEVCRVDDLSKLLPGSYGIPEPTGKPADESALELIIVPAAAFDRKLGRMGYGGGYYDRFLVKTGAVRCAVAFSVQETAKARFEETDAVMDMVITEKEMILDE